MMAIGGKVSSKVSIGCVTVYVSWPSLFLIFPDTFSKCSFALHLPCLTGLINCFVRDQATAHVYGRMATHTKANGKKDSRMVWACTRIPMEMFSKEHSNKTSSMDMERYAVLKV